jgi:phage terminase large subunit GpA-like protein
VRLVLVGTVAAKDTIAAALAKNELHLPRWVDELWLRQLCAEVPVIRISRGRKVRAWELRPGQRRNEALDTLVYALAAAAVAGDRGRTGKEWRGLPARAVLPVPAEAGAVVTKEKPAPQMKRGPMTTGWL